MNIDISSIICHDWQFLQSISRTEASRVLETSFLALKDGIFIISHFSPSVRVYSVFASIIIDILVCREANGLYSLGVPVAEEIE